MFNIIMMLIALVLLVVGRKESKYMESLETDNDMLKYEISKLQLLNYAMVTVNPNV